MMCFPGERVLCFHGPLLYEAKVGFIHMFVSVFINNFETVRLNCVCLFLLLLQCVKTSIKDKQIKYFIHYSGWNKKWAALLWVTFSVSAFLTSTLSVLVLVFIKVWIHCFKVCDGFFYVAAGMNGFLKAEFSNMWTATSPNKESFKRPISKFQLQCVAWIQMFVYSSES